MTGREHGQDCLDRAFIHHAATGDDAACICGAQCDHAGHEWADAGGGLLICLACEAEKWADSDDPVTVHGGHVPEPEDIPGG